MEPAGPPCQFYFDQPTHWKTSGRCIFIRGWCFSPTGRPILGVRLRTPSLTVAGVVGLPRPDVKAALPAAPDNQTGFEIRGTLPGGRVDLCIEAQLPDGTWWELVAHAVRVKRLTLPLWLGGGGWQELLSLQMPTQMAYPPRTLRWENFPPRAGSTRLRFTIVTPSYNQAQFLADSIRSVLTQSGVDCDYLVQDGGSTDGSRAIIERLAQPSGKPGDRRPEAGKDNPDDLSAPKAAQASRRPRPAGPRLLAWASERDTGQADAIARGFARTDGSPDDLMAWLNSDDFYLPGALGWVADYFAAHPEVDVVYGHRILVNDAAQEIGRWFLPQHDPAVLRLYDFVPQETLFWRRRIWLKAGGIDPSFRFAMDWDLLLRFQAAGAKIVRVPCFLACFRVHAAQKTSARMHDLGRNEITLLRERTHGRPIPPPELEQHPRLLGYLRRSAFLGFLWRLGISAP